MPRRIALIAGLLALLAPAAARAAQQPVALIGKNTHWRYYMVNKTLEVRDKSGEVSGMSVVRRGRKWVQKKVPTRHSALPPETWRAGEFDDGGWPRRRLAVMSTRGRAHSLLCARTQFRVADPAMLGGVTLSVDYRGGVVVYVNGAEVARQHLPKGKINPHTLAEDYPKEAYLDPGGYLLRMGWGDSGRYRDRFAKRVRHLRSITVPAARLRKGVNTLAVELHRPPTDIVLLTGKTRKYPRDSWCPWTMLGLRSLTLLAADSRGIEPPAGGLHVNNVTTMLRLFRDDEGDPCRETRPVRIRGARNGAFSAQVLVTSAAAIKGLRAAPSDLKSKAGTIAAERVGLRYPRRDGPARVRRGVGTFEGLAPEPPPSVAVPKGATRAGQPVWITVHVPKDAPAGDYRGALTLSADGVADVRVPLELSVADWALPDPVDFVSMFELVQSPESLAMRYKVPMWSAKHWALIDRSFEWMGKLGAQTIYIPLFRESCFGNEHSLIRWIKKQDGTWDHDFGIFEKYVDTAVEHLGRLQVICIHSWPRSSGGAYFGIPKYKRKGQPFRFSVLDPKTGALTKATGPNWADKNAAAFFKPVFDGIRKRLRKRGLESAMMVGIGHDVIPSKACVDVLAKVSGGAKWVMHCHPQRWRCRSQPVGYLAHVWGSPVMTLNPKRRRYGWKEKRLYATFPRAGSGTGGRITSSSPLLQYRVAIESAICAGIRGYGWIGADFWPVVKGPRGRLRIPFDRYPGYDRRGNLGISHAFAHLLTPGKDGAIATVRFEMVREGAQETEARVFVERALHDPAKKAKLGADLAKRCKALLDGRIRNTFTGRGYWDSLVWLDWEKQKGDLYAAAAEVANALRK